MVQKRYRYLEQVHFPSDLKRIPESDLPVFCEELRDFIIRHVSEHGGHFGANLGVVELTTALHYVFDAPKDLLVWDVGHQAYGHKIITGRREVFHTNRKYGGISGFPKRKESIYDTFGVGHSSTAISAALGMAEALKMQEKEGVHVVAIVGDGAMTAGLAFEGLNNAGFLKSDLLVILNDNNMSIDPNVGALSEYMTNITTSRIYNRIRDEVSRILDQLDLVGEVLRKVGGRLEDALVLALSRPGILFEALGFRYFGPIDGHDVNHLVRILRDLKEIRGPRLLHVKTVKGKGFLPAEQDQTKWHAASTPFDIKTGEKIEVNEKKSDPLPLLYQEVFGESLIELASMDKRIVAITPAMISGHGLSKMQKLMPDRVYDVGIAEQHAVTFSAGLSTQGMIPFCCIYSTFCQRAYDQVIHDVAIQDLHVIFALDRAGLVGADGPTHHGAYDLAYMRCIPNMIVSAPMDEGELRRLMYTALSVPHPFVIRYPRGKGVLREWRVPFEAIPVGKGRLITPGEDIAILSIGHAGNLVQEAIRVLNERGIYPAHYDMRFVKPLDSELLEEVMAQYRVIVTVEDGCIMGGFGSAILEWMADHHAFRPVYRLGIPDRVVEHGTQPELYRECGYDAAGIIKVVETCLTTKKVW